MASPVDVVDVGEVPDHVVVHEGLMVLRLEVADPEVIAELQKHPEGAPRNRYASGALRLGVFALRQASGELDSTAVRQAGEEILHHLDRLLTERGTKITGEIGSALRQYFDPAAGALPQRIESLLKQDGDLERALRQHVGPGDSTIAKALEEHLGPLLRLLSPEDADGLKARIQSMLEDAFDEQQQRILKEFSLDSEDSSLSRLVRKVRESNGDLTSDVKAQVEGLIGEFSLDKPDSALSRLVGKVEAAQALIGNSLTLDDEASPLSRMKRELLSTIDGLAKNNTEFQAEVRATLERLQTQRETAAKSTLHGHTFEDQLGELLAAEARRLNDIHECTGNTTGVIAHCKVGDFVATLGPDSAAPGARIVWEAKSNKSYDLAGALAELDQARKNRQAQVGVFVFSKAAAPEGLEPFTRYGNDLIILWDPDDASSDLWVKAALTVARALVIRETHESAESEQALNAIDLAARAIEKQLGYLDDIKTQAETVKNNGEKIADRAGKIRKTLAEQLSELDGHIAALKTGAAKA
jgi:hypothetical protein